MNAASGGRLCSYPPPLRRRSLASPSRRRFRRLDSTWTTINTITSAEESQHHRINQKKAQTYEHRPSWSFRRISFRKESNFTEEKPWYATTHTFLEEVILEQRNDISTTNAIVEPNYEEGEHRRFENSSIKFQVGGEKQFRKKVVVCDHAYFWNRSERRWISSTELFAASQEE